MDFKEKNKNNQKKWKEYHQHVIRNLSSPTEVGFDSFKIIYLQGVHKNCLWHTIPVHSVCPPATPMMTSGGFPPYKEGNRGLMERGFAATYSHGNKLCPGETRQQ